MSALAEPMVVSSQNFCPAVSLIFCNFAMPFHILPLMPPIGFTGVSIHFFLDKGQVD